MNATFDQGSQHTEQQINVAGNFYHYGAAPHGRTQPSTASSNRPPVLHNLPQRDYTQFIGRAAELQKVQQILRPYPHSQHAFVSIDGIGGVGKSTLALEVAHRFLDQYDTLPPNERFAAIIWTSAKERTLNGDGIKPRYQTHRTLDDLYRTIAITLQREDIAKAVFDQQAALLHTILIQQRTLVIVDNLETIDDDAVVNFIRELPAPTKVIVTTRHRIDVTYAVRLAGMPYEDAEFLITQECHNRNIDLTLVNMQRLFDRTGGIPLAIVWSLAQMHFGYPPETVLNRLGMLNNDVTRFCFDGSIELIRETTAYRILLALSLFRDGSSRDALGKVSDVGEFDRDDGLVILEKLSLVNRGAGRFKPASPLVEAYTHSLLAENETLESELRERWIGYLQEFIDQKHVHKFNTIDDVIPEMRNILDAMDWCRNRGRLEPALQLMSKIDFYLWASGNWNIRNDYLYHSLNAGAVLDSELTQANYLRRLADIRDMQGDWEQSMALASQALTLFERRSDEYGMLLALYTLSATYYKQQEFQLAKEAIHRALAIARKLNDNKVLMRVIGRLGTICLEAEDYQAAKIYLTQAVQLEQSLDEYQRKSWSSPWVYRLVGRMHLGEKRYAESKENLEYSLSLAKGINNPQEISETTSRLAELYFAMGFLEKAKEMADSALETFRRLGMKRHIARTETLLRDMSQLGQQV